MKAQLKKSDGSAYPSDQVFWQLSGATKAGTTIDEDTGVLTVAADEPLDTVLNVTAISLVDPSKTTTKTVTVVRNWTRDTVTLDNIEFYVLYRDTTNKRALLLSKDVLMQKAIDSADTTHWHTSELRNYLNNEWLSGKTEINSFIQSATIKIRKNVDSTEYDTDNCKVFLLSQADVCGKQWFGGNGSDGSDQAAASDDYTVPGQKLSIPGGGSWAATYNGSAAWWWLRSPRYYTTCTAMVQTGGEVNYSWGHNTAGGVRPAFWVTIP